MTDLTVLTPQRKARIEAGLSIRQMERLTGINRGMLSLYEQGRLLLTLEQQRRVVVALTEAEQDKLA